MKDVPPELHMAMREALNEAERQLRAETPYDELRPDREYQGWTFDRPDGSTLYVEGVAESPTSSGVPVRLTVYGQGGCRRSQESRLVVLPLPGARR